MYEMYGSYGFKVPDENTFDAWYFIFFNLYVNNYLYSEYENESSEKYFLNNFSDGEKNLIFNNKFIKIKKNIT